MTFTTKLAASAIAFATAATTAAAETQAMSDEDLIRTRDITGGAIYTMTTDADAVWTDSTMYTSLDTDWTEIGEIEDIILNEQGQMVGVIAEVGGFLDIGDKHVMIPTENVKLAAVDDQTYALVTDKSEEQLEEMESFDEGVFD